MTTMEASEGTDSATPMTTLRPTAPTAARSRRDIRLGVVVLIALVAAAVGVVAGSRLRQSSVAPPTPPMTGSVDEVLPRPSGAGSSAVYISSRRQQLVGVRTAQVARQHVEGTVRTVGNLVYDETRTVQIHTRVAGWIERLFVDYVGKPVRRGQPLFALYSPDLETAQAEYLVALRARQQIGDGATNDAKTSGDLLLAASRKRMKLWDVSDAQISALERAGQPVRTMMIASPFDGVVLEKTAFAGQYVTPETMVFRLGDLESVWVVGQLFEYEAAAIRVGDLLDVEFPYGQAATLHARVDFIYPEVDPMTRRVRFRAVLPNADRKLKPDTYVTLVWHGAAVDRLVVAKEAVIDTGERQHVLLALGNGYFEPRDVHIGPPIGELYPVLDGIVEGDRVVTSAQFLVDSETNLKAAMQGMALSMPGMDMGAAGSESTVPAPAPHATGSSSPAPVPPATGSSPPAPMPPMPGM